MCSYIRSYIRSHLCFVVVGGVCVCARSEEQDVLFMSCDSLGSVMRDQRGIAYVESMRLAWSLF